MTQVAAPKWVISSDRALTQDAMYAIGEQVREWADHGASKPIILSDGLVLHDVEHGKTYGGPWLRNVSFGYYAMGCAAGGLTGGVLGALIVLIVNAVAL